MPDKYEGIEEMDLGIQDDGEPAVVTDPEPKPDTTAAAVETPAETVDVETKPEDSPEQPHKKTGSQRARERAEREMTLRIAAERERDELKSKLSAPQAQTDPNEPKLEDFEDFGSWKSALAKHHETKATAQAEIKFKAEQEQRAQEEAKKRWQAEDAKFSATTPDWDDAIEDLTEAIRLLPVEHKPGFEAIGAALSASDIAPALKYYLGKNPNEFTRIAALDPIRAIKEMDRLEIKLAEPSKPKQTSQAPPPIRPVSSTSGAAVDTKYGGIEEF